VVLSLAAGEAVPGFGAGEAVVGAFRAAHGAVDSEVSLRTGRVAEIEEEVVAGLAAATKREGGAASTARGAGRALAGVVFEVALQTHAPSAALVEGPEVEAGTAASAGSGALAGEAVVGAGEALLHNQVRVVPHWAAVGAEGARVEEEAWLTDGAHLGTHALGTPSRTRRAGLLKGLVIASDRNAPLGRNSEAPKISKSVAAEATAVELAGVAVIGAGHAEPGGLVLEETGGAGRVAELVRHHVVVDGAAGADRHRLAQNAAQRALQHLAALHQQSPRDNPRLVVPRQRLAPCRGGSEDPEISGLVAGETGTGLVAGVAVEGTGLTDSQRAVSKETEWTGGVAKAVGEEEVSTGAVAALSRRLAPIAARSTRGSCKHFGLVVAQHRTASPRFYHQFPEISQTTAQTLPAAVTTHTVEGTFLAAQIFLILAVAQRTAQVAEPSDDEQIALDTGRAHSLGFAGEAASGAGDGQAGEIVEVAIERDAAGGVGAEEAVVEGVAGVAGAVDVAGGAVVGAILAVAQEAVAEEAKWALRIALAVPEHVEPG
jgi:hypothetical protein